MKTTGLLLLSLVLATGTTHGQITVTDFVRAGQLRWTNHLCTGQSVYEVLSANSPTGTWVRLAFVTNQNSFLVTNVVTDGTASRFYKLLWADSEPLELNYEYDEGLGLGCPAAVGALTILFHTFPQQWTGVFRQTDCSLFEDHPEGTRQLTGFWYGENQLKIYLERSPDYAVWLDGTLERSDTTSACTFTRYSGTVWVEMFAETGPLGTFVAAPVQ